MNNDIYYSGSPDNLSAIIEDSDLVAVYIATYNCSTCEVLRPKVQSFFAISFPDVPLVQIKAEEYQTWIAEHMIFSAPVLLIYAHGKETYRGSRFLNFTEIEEKIKKIIELIY